MENLFILLAGDLGALRFVVLILLPFLYFKDSTDVEKEFSNALKELSERANNRRPNKERVKSILNKLYVFELEWWAVAALAVLMIGICFIGNVAEHTTFFSTRTQVKGTEFIAYELELSTSVNVKVAVKDPTGVKKDAELTLSDKKKFESELERSKKLIKGAMNGFGAILALSAMFLIRWSKMEVFRAIRNFYYCELPQ